VILVIGRKQGIKKLVDSFKFETLANLKKGLGVFLGYRPEICDLLALV